MRTGPLAPFRSLLQVRRPRRRFPPVLTLPRAPPRSPATASATRGDPNLREDLQAAENLLQVLRPTLLLSCIHAHWVTPLGETWSERERECLYLVYRVFVRWQWCTPNAWGRA